jgi:hypothetical protein
MTAAAFVFDDGGNDKGNNKYEYNRNDYCSHVMPPVYGLLRTSCSQ